MVAMVNLSMNAANCKAIEDAGGVAALQQMVATASDKIKHLAQETLNNVAKNLGGGAKAPAAAAAKPAGGGGPAPGAGMKLGWRTHSWAGPYTTCV